MKKVRLGRKKWCQVVKRTRRVGLQALFVQNTIGSRLIEVRTVEGRFPKLRDTMNKRLFSVILFSLLLVSLSSCVSTVPVGTSASVYVGPRGYAPRPYYRPYFYNRPPVVVRPRMYYRAPVPRYYRNPGRGWGRGGRRW